MMDTTTPTTETRPTATPRRRTVRYVVLGVLAVVVLVAVLPGTRRPLLRGLKTAVKGTPLADELRVVDEFFLDRGTSLGESVQAYRTYTQERDSNVYLEAVPTSDEMGVADGENWAQFLALRGVTPTDTTLTRFTVDGYEALAYNLTTEAGTQQTLFVAVRVGGVDVPGHRARIIDSDQLAADVSDGAAPNVVWPLLETAWRYGIILDGEAIYDQPENDPRQRLYGTEASPKHILTVGLDGQLQAYRGRIPSSANPAYAMPVMFQFDLKPTTGGNHWYADTGGTTTRMLAVSKLIVDGTDLLLPYLGMFEDADGGVWLFRMDQPFFVFNGYGALVQALHEDYGVDTLGFFDLDRTAISTLPTDYADLPEVSAEMRYTREGPLGRETPIFQNYTPDREHVIGVNGTYFLVLDPVP